MCTGWFGEINKDFDKTIKILAREAVAEIDGMNVFPLVNTDGRGGVFPIMFGRFRRAIGVIKYVGVDLKLQALGFA